MTGSIESGACSGLLKRIADQLDMPVDAFLEPSDERAVIMLQASELIALFCAIADPSARARCLALARALADERVCLRIAEPGMRLERQRRSIRSRRRKAVPMPSLLWRSVRRRRPRLP